MKINHDLHPELNQGPADLQSAALTIELYTLGFCIQSNNHDHHLYTSITTIVPRLLRHQLTTSVTGSFTPSTPEKVNERNTLKTSV